MTTEHGPGLIQERVIVEYPDGTRLSKSRVPGDAPDGRSTLLRDDDNRLAGHGVLRDPDEELLTRSEADHLADERVRDVQQEAEARARITQEEAAALLKLVAGVTAVAGIAVGTLATKAAPHVKTGYSNLKAKLSRKPEPAVEASATTIEVEFIGRGPAQPARDLGTPNP